MTNNNLTNQIRQLDIITNRKVSELFAGNYKSSFKGQGIEVANLRRYVEGDPYRNIDWITSARKGDLYVKEFQETRELTTFMVVDVSSSMNFGTEDNTKRDIAIETASILLFSALKNNDKFGAIIFADTIKSFIPAQKGKTHLLRIFKEIMWHYHNNHHLVGNSTTALKCTITMLKRHSICFYLSDELQASAMPFIQIANKKHDLVFTNIFDPFERGIIDSDLMQIEDIETGQQLIVDMSDHNFRNKYQQLRIQRYNHLRKNMNQNRIDMLDISTQDSVYSKLLLFFKQRQLRR